MRVWNSSAPINGKRIAMARGAAGFTRSEFAAKIGIATSTLRAIEQKRWEMPAQILQLVCLLTGCLPRFFRQGDPPEFPMKGIHWSIREAEKGEQC